MAWRGLLSRSLVSAARPSVLRSSSPPISATRRIRLPPLAAHRRISFSNPRTLGALGCCQSLLPLISATKPISHLTVNVRSCCELSQGT